MATATKHRRYRKRSTAKRQRTSRAKTSQRPNTDAYTAQFSDEFRGYCEEMKKKSADRWEALKSIGKTITISWECFQRDHQDKTKVDWKDAVKHISGLSDWQIEWYPLIATEFWAVDPCVCARVQTQAFAEVIKLEGQEREYLRTWVISTARRNKHVSSKTTLIKLWEYRGSKGIEPKVVKYTATNEKLRVTLNLRAGYELSEDEAIREAIKAMGAGLTSYTEAPRN
jgi:hypothetical protein